jgi:hypothetical protein
VPEKPLSAIHLRQKRDPIDGIAAHHFAFAADEKYLRFKALGRSF